MLPDLLLQMEMLLLHQNIQPLSRTSLLLQRVCNPNQFHIFRNLIGIFVYL